MSDSTIENLKVRYRESCVYKQAVLGEMLERYRKAIPAETPLCLELKDFLHKLAGSSGMYGYDQLHVAARSALACFEGTDSAKGLVAQEDDAIFAVQAVMQQLKSLNT